jgi:hypothetical protein
MNSFRLNVLRQAASGLLLACMAMLGACVWRDDLALLHLVSVESVHREGGEVLRLHGLGLPLGRAGTVTWTGTLRKPGLPSRSVVARTQGRVVAMEVLEVPLDAEAMALFWGGGTFDGSVRAAFDARIGGAEISGSLDEVRVWIRGASVESLPKALAHARRARAFATFAGMTVADEEARGGGVRIESVQGTGAAARAGILAGDVVIEVDGAFVDGVSSFLPQHNADRVQLRIRRPGEVAVVSAWISLGGFENQPPRSDLWLGLALLAFGLGTTLCFGPSTRASRTAIDRMREAWVTRDLGLSLLPALFAVGVAATIIIASELAPFAQHVWLWALAAVSARAAARLARRSALRSRALYRFLIDDLLACAAILILGSLVGTEAIRSFSSLQGESVWTWFALRNPAALLCAWICIEASLVGTYRETPDADGRLVQVVDRAHRAIFAGLIVVMFFGGVHAPSFLDGHVRWQWMVSAGVFAFKVWCVAALSDRLRTAAPVRARVLAACTVICTLLVVGVVHLQLSPVVDTLVAQLTSAGAALLLAWGLLSAYRQRERSKMSTSSGSTPAPSAMERGADMLGSAVSSSLS